MSPQQLIPAAETIPVPWPWFKALLIPCLTLHLLFMNLLLGSTIIGGFQILRTPESQWTGIHDVAHRLPFFMAFTINFGVAGLLFLQVLYGRLFYTSSILMAAWWLATLVLVLGAYGGAYWIDLKSNKPGRHCVWVWMVMMGALLLTGFIFTNNFTLMNDPAAWSRYFQSPKGFLWHFDDPALIPRYLHFVTASVAVGGLALALLNRHRSADQTSRYLNWFNAATVIQFVIGGWFFMALPQPLRQAFMGGNPAATLLFGTALLAGGLTLIWGLRKRVWLTTGGLFFTVFLMVWVRDTVRTLYLEPFVTLDELVVQPEYTPMMVFALVAVLGTAAVIYMIHLYFKKPSSND